MSEYFVHNAGTATKENAVGPASNLAACMSLVTFNLSTFSPGDIVYFSARGGDYSLTVDMDEAAKFSGSLLLPLKCIGLSDNGRVTIDRSAFASGHCFSLGDPVGPESLNYVEIEAFDLKGSGGSACVELFGTGGTLGGGYNVVMRDVNVLENIGGANGGDGFAGASSSAAELRLIDCGAARCRPDPQGVGSDSCLASHGASKIWATGGTWTDSNSAFIAVNDSSIRVDGGAIINNIYVSVLGGSTTGSVVLDDAVLDVNLSSSLLDPASGTGKHVISNSAIIITGGADNALGTETVLYNNVIICNSSDMRLKPTPGKTLHMHLNDVTVLAANFQFIYYGTGSGTVVDLQANTWDTSGVSQAIQDGGATTTGIVAGNIIKNTGAAGWWYTNQATATSVPDFVNNTFYRPTLGGGEAIDLRVAAACVPVIKSNIFANWAQALYISGATTPDIDANLWNGCTVEAGGTATTGTNAQVDVDPLFTDAANEDFTLQSGSPCLGAGADYAAGSPRLRASGGNLFPLVGPDIGGHQQYSDHDPSLISQGPGGW